MEEKQETIRPTKKQKELLEFIETFITANGYSPSYREIMKGLNYSSVATVALHVNSLINRGHLRKRGNSARSLEVIRPSAEAAQTKIVPKQLKEAEEKWLIDKVEIYFKEAESAAHITEQILDQLYVLVGALKILGAHGASSAFATRLNELKKKQAGNQYLA